MAIVSAAVIAAGCGGRRTAQLVPVQGVVRQGDHTLSQGQVVFVPVPPHQAPLAFGDIGSDGRYSLRSANRHAGIVPGVYAVCIHAAEATAPLATDVDPLLRPAANLMPTEYTSHDTTPLRCDVPPGGMDFDIDLPAISRGVQ